MNLSGDQIAFINKSRSAAMVTLRADGTPHAVRVGVVVVDGRVWSSGTEKRLRTRLLRHDPRCTFFVFEPGFGFLTLEGAAKILEGPDVPTLSLKLFQTMQAEMAPPPTPGHILWNGKEMAPDEFIEAMIQERRLIYELEVERAYGPSMR
jgi:hypothetical protein